MTDTVRDITIGNARLILGDSRGILPTLPRPDALISDPPYGQKHKTNIFNKGGHKIYRRSNIGGGENVIAANRRSRTGCYSGGSNATVWPAEIEGDDMPFDPAHLLKAADIVLLWGFHKFHDKLPLGSVLVWDKVPTGKVRDQGDGEAAWINDVPPRPMRIYRLLWDGVCVGSAARHEVTAGQPRLHPTQKPEAVMSFCIEQLNHRLKPASTICDPYAGSGSTGVSALRAGHKFIGIESQPVYFETMLRRLTEAQRQTDMFTAAAV